MTAASTAPSRRNGPATERAKSARNRWIVLAVLCANLVMVGMDLTVLHVAVPTLSRQLLPSGLELLWIVDAYALTVAALLITGGTLADRFGRKRMLVSGFAVFGLASAGAAFAPTPALLIAGRVGLGVGAAMIMASTVAIIRTVFTDDRERTLAIGLWTASHSLGAAVGPLIGGALLQHLWWGAVFLINVPIVVLAIAIGSRIIPESKDPHPRSWDVASAVLSVVGLGGIVFGLKQFGEYGPRAVAFVALAAGVGAITLFIRRQNRLAEPLLDLSMFRNAMFSAAIVCIIISYGIETSLLFLVTQKFQLIDGLSPLTAGAALIPFAIAAGVGAVVAARVATLIGHRHGTVLGMAVTAAGLAAIAGLTSYATVVTIGALLIVVGLGVGIVVTLGSDLVMTAAPAERAGQAGAVQETSFELGAGLGIVALGTTLGAFYRTYLPSVPGVSATDLHTAGESLGAATEVASRLPAQVGEALRTGAGDAFLVGFTVAVTVAAVIVMVAAVLTAVVMRRHPAGQG